MYCTSETKAPGKIGSMLHSLVVFRSLLSVTLYAQKYKYGRTKWVAKPDNIVGGTTQSAGKYCNDAQQNEPLTIQRTSEEYFSLRNL